MADAETGTESIAPENAESRSLLVGSFRRAFAETDSWVLKSYVVVSALLGGLLVVFLLLALPVWIFNTAGGSELATFSRAFLVVGGGLVLVPLVVPVLSAARRHRRATASARADLLLALSGYLFVLSLYLALLVSAPADARETPSALVAPVVEFLYALPPVYALVPPLIAVLLVALTHRFAR